MSNRKIRILHICETGGIGGAEKVLLNIVTNLDSTKYESSVILFKNGWLGEKLRQNSISVSILESNQSMDFGFMSRFLRKIKDIKPDIIHSHLPDANAYSSLAGLISRVPVITTYHGKIAAASPIYRPSTYFKYLLVKRLSTKVVAVSEYLKKDLCRLAGFPQGKIVTIHNGVIDDNPSIKFDARSLKEELGISEDEFVVGNVANMRTDKGYEYFIRACARIHAQMPKTKFLVVGEERPDIKAVMVEELGKSNLGNNVLFLGFRENIIELLNIFDVFMLSSTSEGLSISTIEAMFAGVPVVATQCGGPSEIINDGENGFLVPIKDAESLALKALYLLRNRDVAAQMAERAKKHVNKNFSISNMTNLYMNLYDEIVH